MPRTENKWLIAWYGPERELRDAVEHRSFIRPVTWAQKRCNEDETFEYWNIGNPEDEKKVREALYNGNIPGNATEPS